MMLALTVRQRRYLGLGLVGYGLAGVLLLAVAGAVIGGAIQELNGAAATIGDQRDALLGTLRATSLTMRNASAGVGNVGASLTAAHASADHAAGLARSMGNTLRGLSAAMNVQVFGTRPLAGLTSGFDNAAGQSEELGRDLDAVGTALARNTTDLETSRKDLAALSDRVDLLVAAVETTPFGVAQEPLFVELVFVALLFWLAVPAVASIAVGVVLLRAA